MVYQFTFISNIQGVYCTVDSQKRSEGRMFVTQPPLMGVVSLICIHKQELMDNTAMNKLLLVILQVYCFSVLIQSVVNSQLCSR